MDADEHHKIMKATVDRHLDAMPNKSDAILMSIDHGDMNISVVSTLEDEDVITFLKLALAIKAGETNGKL